MSEQAPSATHKALLAAARSILRALARVLLRHGVPYPVFSELARWVYVDVATREFGLPGRKQTRSRVSVLTGLSRKEVQRLQEMPPPGGEDEVERFHRASRIVSAWTREARYRNELGEPLLLPFDGDGPTFSELVARFGADVPPRAVLDELLRTGTVERLPDGRVRLRTRAYLPQGADPQRLAVLGEDVSALIATIDHNLTAEPAARWPQRHVAYRGVPAAAVSGVRELAAQEGQRVLETLDRVLADHLAPGDPGPRSRVRFGVFWHEEPEDEGGNVGSGDER
ncbi:DUF6502 family protein [Deferrisoma palaeochoriense]